MSAVVSVCTESAVSASDGYILSASDMCYPVLIGYVLSRPAGITYGRKYDLYVVWTTYY